MTNISKLPKRRYKNVVACESGRNTAREVTILGCLVINVRTVLIIVPKKNREIRIYNY